MKILHTSDWHLNSTLRHRKRNEDLDRSLAQIKDYLDQYNIDVMIVSGDLFRERSRPEQAQTGIHMIREHFLPFVQRGGTILAISGNHDSEVFFTTLHEALDLVSPVYPTHDGLHTPGRLYIASDPSLIKLADRTGEIVQFVLMPYPSVRYLRGSSLEFTSPEQRNQAIANHFRNILHRLQNRLDVHYPSILVSHIHVRGMETNAQYRLSDRDEVTLEQSDLLSSWSYVALGHIHSPQEAIPGRTHMRYAGSIECMDYGEKEDRKSVVLLEMKERQVGSLELLELQSTPFEEVEITDPETEIPLLAEKYPQAQQSLIRYILHYDSSVHDRERLCRQIEEVFPRWYDRIVKDKRTGESTEASLSFGQTRDIVGTTRQYLQAQLENHPDREALLQLANQLFLEEELV
ncbi:MAG: exonuclease SbcCD subunit D [Ktedonobacteraceae bacterium]|nr:exonuclease SbcCD subunit D [Ktedonobacteraceae bacterium]